MASISKYLFLTPQEFSAWLKDEGLQGKWQIVLYMGSYQPMTKWNGVDFNDETVRRIYAAPASSMIYQQDINTLDIGRLGWIQMDVPRIKGDTLYGVQISCKTDFLDKETSTVMLNPMARRSFQQFWLQWKRHFTFPMMVRNKLTSAEGLYKSIGYSAGARLWFLQGGHLRQEGVENIQFLIPS